MADESSYSKLQRLSSEVPKSHANASKFYYHFLYKAFIVTIFLVALPLFSSQAPDFISQKLHTTSWELFQLIFVGIAVSYGLFSKRSDEKEKDHSSRFDNAQLYISRLLQVSSVFDDEPESSPVLDDSNVQTWNSQCYRGEPMVVVAKETPGHEFRATTNPQIGEKPLYLPVRSLKSRVCDSDMLETTKVSDSKAGCLSRSSSGPGPGSGSKRFSGNGDMFTNGEFWDLRPINLEEEVAENAVRGAGSKRFSGNANRVRNENPGGVSALNLEEMEENVIHPSPIPWRSRSARMERTVDGDSELNRFQTRSFRSLSSVTSRADSNSPSPNKLPHSPSGPSLSSPRKNSPPQAKSSEDVVRKRSLKKFSPPPPPPPLPPPFIYKPTRMKSNSGVETDDITSRTEMRRSIRSVPAELSHNMRVEAPRRAISGSEFRTAAQIDDPFISKSAQIIKPCESIKKPMNVKESDEDITDEKAERWSKKMVETFFENVNYSDKLMHESFPNMSRPKSMEVPEAADEEYVEKVVVETDEDTETENEDDYFEESLGKEQQVISSSTEEPADESVTDGGPDVNKKADEFIAKFREQIRLQRIESIRKSTVQPARIRSR